MIDPPITVEFIKEPFWALHEAAFVLTDTWPDKVILNIFSAMPINLDRKHLYLPTTSDDSSLKPEEHGEKFSQLYVEILNSIHQGILPALFAPIWNNIAFFVTPRDIIHWALIQGKTLPNSLQLALHF